MDGEFKFNCIIFLKFSSKITTFVSFKETSKELSILRAKMSDQGQYTCYAKNEYGKDSFIFTVHLEGKTKGVLKCCRDAKSLKVWFNGAYTTYIDIIHWFFIIWKSLDPSVVHKAAFFALGAFLVVAVASSICLLAFKIRKVNRVRLNQFLKYKPLLAHNAVCLLNRYTSFFSWRSSLDWSNATCYPF